MRVPVKSDRSTNIKAPESAEKPANSHQTVSKQKEEYAATQNKERSFFP